MAEHEDVEIRFARLEGTVGTLFETVNRRFDGVDASLDHRQYTEHAFETLRTEVQLGFRRMDQRFNRLEHTLDQFVDTQSKTNELTERRLTRLESA